MKAFIHYLTVVLCLFATTVILGMTAGYVTETYAQKHARCINSACENTCKHKVFIRHEGCLK